MIWFAWMLGILNGIGTTLMILYLIGVEIKKK